MTVSTTIRTSSAAISYRPGAAHAHRTIQRRDGTTSESRIPQSSDHADPAWAYWKSWLACDQTTRKNDGPETRVVDLFSGCGGLSVGVREAINSLGDNERLLLAADLDPAALAVFSDNFSPDITIDQPIEALIDGKLGQQVTMTEAALIESLGEVDLLVGGPPCQGNSDLNNHTRRNDPKNALYLRMVRFAEIAGPDHLIIENVPGVRHDHGRVVEKAKEALASFGYSVTDGVVSASDLGWPQARKRHLLLASRSVTPDLDNLQTEGAVPIGVSAAISDLAGLVSDSIFDSSSRHSERNRERIAFLFANNLYELPDAERPDCHRLKPHSYKSVYGRMRPDEPAPTITAGFGSTGQGRFVHPELERTLTPHEAARVQGFPDSFRFDACDKRRALQQLIGNAVPSILGFAAAVELLR